MATIVDPELVAPRLSRRMTKRCNVSCTNAQAYCQHVVFIPTLDSPINELECMF